MYTFKAPLLFVGLSLVCAFVGTANGDQDSDLRRDCRYADALQNEYNVFIKITDLKRIRPEGFIAHFPFYVKAERDVHVLFTTGPRAVREANEYEIVIGGWGGTQTVIRRQQQSQQPLATAKHSVIISTQKWTEYLLQITTRGNIKLLRKGDNGLYKLIVEANDSNPLPVEYISFGSWENNHVEFFFDCSFSTDTPEVVFNNTSPIDICASSMLNKTDKVIDGADTPKQCLHADATQNEYNDFYKITDLPGVRPKGFIVQFPFYVKADHDAHVLLTKGPEADREADEYEIVIGGWGGTQTVIRRKQQSQQPLGTAQHSGIISKEKWTKYLLQITTQGNVTLLRKEDNDSYKIIVEANDPNPLPVQYISFGSWENNHIEFYFNCSHSNDQPTLVFHKTPAMDICAFERKTNADNALQDANFKQHCEYADAMQNEYNDFYRITDLSGVRTQNFIVHFSFFVRAQRDAHVLFTTRPRARRGANEYEIVIGGWGGTQTVIRRQQQSQQPLASVRHSEIISSEKWTEFLLQTSAHGKIKLFNKVDNDSYKLIVEANDSNPLPVEFISFGSWENNHVEFFFDCSFSTDTPDKVLKKTSPVVECGRNDQRDVLEEEGNDAAFFITEDWC